MHTPQEANQNLWHGLDSDVDTEDEAELAIRCFPSILNRGDLFARPIYKLVSHAKAISFVPLFAKLGAELGRFPEHEKGGLVCKGVSVVDLLWCDDIATEVSADQAHCLGPALYTEDFDEKSFSVLTRLIKSGTSLKTVLFRFYDDYPYGFQYEEGSLKEDCDSVSSRNLSS